MNEYIVKDLVSYHKEITYQNPKLFMELFGIKLLFTNIPLNETINICTDIVYDKRS